jgi:hypothetical protein
MCRGYDVVPQYFLTDNGSTFTSCGFQAHLATFNQIIRFACVGAHHQNGHAKCAIQTVMAIAWTMMLHAVIHCWPDVVDPQLWPMAVQHAVWLQTLKPACHLTTSSLKAAIPSTNSMTCLHVFGCPIYVLNKTIVDGKNIPRWQPHSISSVNVVLSPTHATFHSYCFEPFYWCHYTPEFNVVLMIGLPLLLLHLMSYLLLTLMNGPACLGLVPSPSLSMKKKMQCLKHARSLIKHVQLNGNAFVQPWMQLTYLLLL